MNVLHVGKYFPPYAGGMETFLRDLCAAQLRQGVACTALVHSAERRFRSRHEWVALGRHGLSVRRAAVWFTLLFTPISPGFALLARRIIRRERPDVIHIHMPNVSAFWLLLLPGARRLPWIIHWHSDVLASRHSRGLRLFYGLYRPLERAMLQRAAAIICSSPPYCASSLPLQPFAGKTRVIPLGLDRERLQPGLRPVSDLPGAAPADAERPLGLRVLMVGRHTYYKGIDVLLEAVALASQVQLHLIGSGECTPALRRRCAALDIDHRVHFHGNLPDSALAAQLEASDCVVLSSIERTEAFGMILLEAMCFGKAVIATDVPGSGMSWVVQDGVCGRVVSVGDSAALAAAFGDFLRDRAKLRTFGVQGRQRFLGHFDIDRIAPAIARLYTEVTRGT